ncbi:MAG: hypothetical protein GXO08_03940, partial [Aquificae bacterium]|nr:hypothetical protein [Aquificota bacterium]
MPYRPREFFKKLTPEGESPAENLKRFADGVVSQSGEFFKKTFRVENAALEVYSYLNAPCEAFEKLNAHELRGLTFVKTPEGETKHFLSLHKFFNLGECEEYKLQNLKGLKLLEVYEKLDG